MSELIRYAVLGCGMMGQEHLRNIALIEGARVDVIIEPDPVMKERSKCFVPDAIFFDDLEQFLSSEVSVEALLIATPNYQHADQLISLFEKTDLPILAEKPIVTSLEQAARLLSAVKGRVAPVWVAMEYRYMPPVAKFREQIEQGDIGNLVMLNIREHRFPFLEKVGDWNRFNEKTGGTLVEKCCHFFDLMRLITQGEAVRVFASAAQNINHLDEQYDSKTPDILDNAFVIVDFDNGRRAALELSMFAEGARYQEEISAVGSTAKLECFVPGPGRFWPVETLGPAPVPKVILSPRLPKGPIESDIPVDPTLLDAGDHNGSTFYQHQGFFEAITQGSKVDVSLEDGIKAVVLGLAAQDSAQSGKVAEITEGGFSYRLS